MEENPPSNSATSNELNMADAHEASKRIRVRRTSGRVNAVLSK